MLTLAKMVHEGLIPATKSPLEIGPIVAPMADSQYHFNNDPKSEEMCESGVSLLVFRDHSFIIMDNENRKTGYADDLVGVAHLLAELRGRTPSNGLTRAINSILKGVNDRLKDDPNTEGAKEILDILK